jgi:hypothetical protein
MANFTPVKPGVAGQAFPFAPTTPAGDTIDSTGGDLLVEFQNTHSASITVNFVPTVTSGRLPGAGRVTIPTRSLAIPAGGFAIFLFKADELKAYLNGSRKIPVTYTSGNVALLMRAVRTQ